jgi:tRNA-specific 2-thiouridylase
LLTGVSSGSLIVAALSGGVDSATAAAMLVDAGHRVVGVTMRLYDARGTTAAAGRCCGPRDIEDARQVCSHLGIPFYVFDFSEDFRHRVIDDFVDSYLAGHTPNPCVRCNQHIKFTPLLRRARALGADVVATGHYARIEASDGGPVLRRGRDPGKDQSYFLFSMPAHELGAIWFPLGDLDKDEVRERARRYQLPNADKPESQEICFVPDGDYGGFVEAAALARGRPVPGSGDIVRDGAVVGRHRGVHRYTIGQRRGLGDVGGGAPVYVTALDRERNRVVGGGRADAARGEIAVGDVRWLGPRPVGPLRALVQVRHRARPVEAELAPANDHGGDGSAGGDAVSVRFLGAPLVCAPGQAAVFYDGDTVLGGGWIQAPPAAQPAPD